MRPRKISNMNTRRDACRNLRIDYRLDSFDYRLDGEKKKPIDTAVIFGMEAPLVMEIGCGKGQFICEYARRHPEKNIIAVECVAGILVEACERVMENGLENIRFMEMKAEYLPLFIKENSVEKIFLNFSTPYPKSKHESHRLTSPGFLEIYRSLLRSGGSVIQKTDSELFFDYSLESFKNGGFEIQSVCRDLKSGDYDNIVTEYEQKFRDLGMRIFRLEAIKRD